jgi:hypothetical protein
VLESVWGFNQDEVLIRLIKSRKLLHFSVLRCSIRRYIDEHEITRCSI